MTTTHIKAPKQKKKSAGLEIDSHDSTVLTFVSLVPQPHIILHYNNLYFCIW